MTVDEMSILLVPHQFTHVPILTGLAGVTGEIYAEKRPVKLFAMKMKTFYRRSVMVTYALVIMLFLPFFIYPSSEAFFYHIFTVTILRITFMMLCLFGGIVQRCRPIPPQKQLLLILCPHGNEKMSRSRKSALE